MGGRVGLSVGIDNLDFRLPKNAHGVWREEVRPHPVMMVNDPFRTEMRSIADRVAVGDRDHFEAQRSGRTDSRIDAKVSGPTGHQKAIHV